MATVQKLIQNQCGNYVFPFFWLHGEDEATLRHYMEVIDKANCHGVCIESRPHPDFCGEKWWKDMDVILDEARKRNMKVWILDDSHFPTGYANGAVKKAPTALRRQSVYCRRIPVKAGATEYKCNLTKLMKKIPTTLMASVASKLINREKFDDDQLLSVTVLRQNASEPELAQFSLKGDLITVQLPQDVKKICITFLTRNAGIHRNYINMMDDASCRLLIDAVYEPHWEHYKADFGKTIAGFFSDEPELGNGVHFTYQVKMGADYDYPWSRKLEKAMPAVLGKDWKRLLPVLWDEDSDPALQAKLRHAYMDAVTQLVEQCFSRQIGNWCAEHGVMYIGHPIEDHNAHGHTGLGLGHYFRGISGQNMAGIDDIGGQVIPQKEDAPAEGISKLLGGRDGEFNHYALGKLGASAAAIDPQKQGRCMCEVFGNYGWSEGPRLEKFLVDHFMVQGINRFVPHAFSGKKYPDSDCPPHFYAHGHNPQYRHFGRVMAYTNRVCALISDGKPFIDTAILYHADGEWAGNCMLMQKPARVLTEHQCDFHFIPADVFSQRQNYRTEIADGLHINGNCYRHLIVPYMQYIPQALNSVLEELHNAGVNVIFVEALPTGVIQGEKLSQALTHCRARTLSELVENIPSEVKLSPSAWRMRSYHYQGDEEIYLFFNEDNKPYMGTASIPAVSDCYRYDAWNNRAVVQKYTTKGATTNLELCLYPGESCIVVVGSNINLYADTLPVHSMTLADGWVRSVCKSIDYPKFSKPIPVSTLEDYGKEDPKFSGFIAYETKIQKPQGSRFVLEITDAGEDAELFVNGVSAGIQILPPFRYDIAELLCEGENQVRIEIATTLERERKVNKKNWQPIGVTGDVNLYYE